MSEMNRVSASILPADIAAITGAVATIQSKLPFLVGLSDDERKSMLKMGDKSEGTHEKCLGYMGSNPEFLPGFVNKAEVDKDQALRASIMQFFPQLTTMFRAVDDTLMVINSELWMADLAYYQNVREASGRDIPGAQAIYDDLKTRFPGRPAKKKTP